MVLTLQILVGLALAGGLVWLLARVFLAAPDHARYEGMGERHAGMREVPSPQRAEVEAMVEQLNATLGATPRLQRLQVSRRLMDEGLGGGANDPASLGVDVLAVAADQVRGEWVTAPGADPALRLLYIHGGGFYVGSPRSHRPLTAALARLTGASVFAASYRLMPEHRRADTIEDARAAYRFVLRQGPDGDGEARSLFVAGDSAGGNLALMLSAWARDAGERLPDAVVGLSPSTDSTMSSPSLRANVATDPLLGPGLGWFVRLPRTVQLLVGLLGGRITPRDPSVSPLFGDLSGLAPTLIQASECEMLLDDAVRYVNKARSHASPAELQTWPGMVHGWQLFIGTLPEADEALEQVAAFLARHTRATGAPATTVGADAARRPESVGAGDAPGNGAACEASTRN